MSDGFGETEQNLKEKARGGDFAACQKLLNLAGVSSNTDVRYNGLQMAAAIANAELCEIFLSLGFDPNGLDAFGSTALHRAQTYNGPNGKVTDLLLAAGASPDFVPPDMPKGWHTPMQEAVKEWRYDVVLRYAAAGADLAQRTASGRTLIQLAGTNDRMKELLRSLKIEAAVQQALEAKAGAGNQPPLRPAAFPTI